MTQPTPTTPLKPKKFPRQRHFLAVFFISFMWGTFGVDRMYLGKWGTGVLKLVTLGGFGVWTIIDLILIMSGVMRDKQGRELLQTAEYKVFAGKTVLIFAIVTGVVVLLNGLVLIAFVMQLITDLQGGDFSNLPGFDALNGLLGPGISPEELKELGL